ncbi:MAG: response regulator transcription factor [Deltaproteobacteria bacterium]|nr:response regulator transcription factor [Deltaproteobacteria bacterium]
MRILLIEDDREAARYLIKGLGESGYVVDHAEDGPRGLLLATSESYDALVVDRMLPGVDGLSVIEALRKNGKAMPVLILSAKGSVDDRVSGLRAGGDDYLVKPFAFAELLARLEALMRRTQPGAAPQVQLRIGDLEMDLLSRTVTRGGRGIELKPREFKILEVLLRHAGHVVTRTMLLESVWDYHFDPQTNVVDVHISRLRQKIDAGFDRPLLHTVRGAGYRLAENASP